MGIQNNDLLMVLRWTKPPLCQRKGVNVSYRRPLRTVSKVFEGREKM